MPNPSSSTPITRARRNRKVSALTAHQVQQKRDLDRKAQRALRQRVKSRLQDLEDDLARAKADCSVRERNLMESVQQLRDENRKLRSYLDSIGQFALNGAAEVDNGDDDDNGGAVDETESPVADITIGEDTAALGMMPVNFFDLSRPSRSPSSLLQPTRSTDQFMMGRNRSSPAKQLG